jgi:hypothetical protein
MGNLQVRFLEVGASDGARLLDLYRIGEELPVIRELFAEEYLALSVGQTCCAKCNLNRTKIRDIDCLFLRQRHCHAESHDRVAIVGGISFARGGAQRPRREHPR